MNTGDTNKSEHAHFQQWLETTRHCLFADQESLADAAVKALLASKLDSHGAQDHLISRVRGRLLRLLTRAAQHDQNPRQELERAFYFQVWSISQHPDVSKRLLGWLSQGSSTRIRQRIQMVIDQYESRLCRMIGQAKHQGLIMVNIEPHIAASFFIGIIQSLALRMNADLHQRKLLLREAVESFALYLAGWPLRRNDIRRRGSFIKTPMEKKSSSWLHSNNNADSGSGRFPCLRSDSAC